MDVSAAKRHYEEGNQMFKRGDYVSAIQHYSTALDGIASKSNTEDQDLFKRLILNRAQCYLYQREFDFAAEDCSVAIALDSTCLKAYVRRAVACENLGHFRKGLADAEHAISLQPGTMTDTIIKLHSRLRNLAASDEKASAAEGRPDKMVTTKQTLRLCFLQSLSQYQYFGEPFQLRLCIGNEFGLWDRSFMSAVSPTSGGDLSIEKIPENQDPFASTVKEKKMISVCAEMLHFDVSRSYTDYKLRPFKSLILSIDEDSQNLGLDGKVSIQMIINRNNLDPLENHSETNGECFIVLKFYLSGSFPCGASVVPILSLPICMRAPLSKSRLIPQLSKSNDIRGAVTKEISAYEVLEIGSKVCASCIRESQVGDVTVYVLESPGLLGIGGKVWDSTYVLAEFLGMKGLPFVSGKRVVELGSGTGMPGLGLCALNPKSVILTDFEEVVPLLKCNIDLNCFMVSDPQLQESLRSKFFATALCWGTPFDPLENIFQGDKKIKSSSSSSNSSNSDCTDGGRLLGHHNNTAIHLNFDCDLVIASDVVYDPAGYEPLVQTLCGLLKGHYRELQQHDTSAASVLELRCIDTKDVPITTLMREEVDSSGKNGLTPYVHTGPICILAHRHRHPENQRFFEILRYQKGIVVELIDRRTGEVLIESKEKIRPQQCHTKKIDEIPIILSDVELYRIFFVLM